MAFQAVYKLLYFIAYPYVIIIHINSMKPVFLGNKKDENFIYFDFNLKCSSHVVYSKR